MNGARERKLSRRMKLAYVNVWSGEFSRLTSLSSASNLLKAGLCHSNSTEHSHHDLETRRVLCKSRSDCRCLRMCMRISGGREEKGELCGKGLVSAGRKELVRCFDVHCAGTTDRALLSLSNACRCFLSSPSSSSDSDVVEGAWTL